MRSHVQISYYNPPSKDVALGGLALGDPRSELVFATFHSKNMAQILLQGFETRGKDDEGTISHPEPFQLSEISPLAQVRADNYRVPTFILHGSEDKVVPVSQSVELDGSLRERGVPSGILVLTERNIFSICFSSLEVRSGRDVFCRDMTSLPSGYG